MLPTISGRGLPVDEVEMDANEFGWESTVPRFKNDLTEPVAHDLRPV
jgi:hypothetical protein